MSGCKECILLLRKLLGIKIWVKYTEYKGYFIQDFLILSKIKNKNVILQKNKCMRIISGKFKGRRLNVPSNITARPTTDFAKEGLFNLLANMIDFEQLTLLDLFAGTGSISLEFVSRNCKSAVAVDNSKIHTDFIRKTCNELKINNLVVQKVDVFSFLKNCSAKFDIIFADPPYKHEHFAEIPDLVLNCNILQPDGIFILEHSFQHNFETHPNFQKHRHYGNVNFSFFE
jgi:16S rRNA (guanine(966)-N(2))-methyltransferase RsmD